MTFEENLQKAIKKLEEANDNLFSVYDQAEKGRPNDFEEFELLYRLKAYIREIYQSSVDNCYKLKILNTQTNTRFIGDTED